MDLEAVAVFEMVHRTLVFSGQPCSTIPESSTTLRSFSCSRRRMYYHLARSSGLDCWVGISAASCDVVSDLFPYTVLLNVASFQPTGF